MQRYFLTIRQASDLASKINLRDRNALRMWFYLKTHGHQDSFYIKELRPELLTFFTYKQAQKYFQILVEKGWMGRDVHGKYYLRGRKTVFSRYNAKSRMEARTIFPEDTETHDAWISFLSGVLVSHCASVASRFDGQRIKVASTSTSGGNSDVKETPLAIEIMTAILGVSAATCSRLRQRATWFGHTTNRVCLEDMSGLLSRPVTSRRDLMEVRGDIADIGIPYWKRRLAHFDPLACDGLEIDQFWLSDPLFHLNANALVFKDGTPYLQRPNMVGSRMEYRKISSGR